MDVNKSVRPDSATVTAKALFDGAATAVLVVCAVVITAATVKRELTTSAGRTTRAPTFVQSWQAYVAGDERIGSADAPVKVVVFSDFQCPACKRLFVSLDSIASRHPSDFVVVHRNFPLNNVHPYARAAAIAAECAAEQGAFPAYHALLFRQQNALSGLSWIDEARSAAVPDIRSFTACLGGGASVSRIVADSEAAVSLGIAGTPLVMVNGLRIDGAPPEETLEGLILKEKGKLANR